MTQDERDALMEVLRPLAEVADAFDYPEWDDEEVVHGWHVLDKDKKPITRTPTVGQFRAVRAALAKLQGG